MVTPDDCPVAAYAALPAEPELSIVRSFIRGRSRVLDLGAGTGRIADPLAIAGHTVVAVDESADMLAHVRHATPVRARIEQFDADERFDAVLLLSHLINTPTFAERSALLATVARHLAPDGLAVIQRHDPSRRFRPSHAVVGDVEISLRDIDDSGWPNVRATSHYQLGDQCWDQPWEAVVLDDDVTTRSLDTAGLRVIHLEGSWVLAEFTNVASSQRLASL